MNAQFLQRLICFSNTCSHPVVFLERPGGMRVISRVTTPIHYTGHQWSAKRFGEAPHHLTHVIPVHLERIPGQGACTETIGYDHNISKSAVKMSPDTCSSVFSELCSPCKYARGGFCKKSIHFHIWASFCTDCRYRRWDLVFLLLMLFLDCTSLTASQYMSYGI